MTPIGDVILQPRAISPYSELNGFNKFPTLVFFWPRSRTMHSDFVATNFI